MRVAAESVAVTMIMIVRMVVAVAVAVVRMAAGFLGLVVHQHDSNRDSLRLTAWILGASMANNGVDRNDHQERTHRPKRI
ncbi:MAG TPA: hypothetical protein VIH88_00405 [Candidatus Acidoferrales bacterium]